MLTGIVPGLPRYALPTIAAMTHNEVLVRGAGVVGRSLALSLSRLGLPVTLESGPKPPAADGPDVRAYALNAASVALLRGLRVWDALPAGAATAVHDMHIEGDASGASLAFSAWTQEVQALAWIVDVAALDAALASAVRYAPHIRVVDAVGPGAPAPALTALCEGQQSVHRAALGVRHDKTPYGHRAIAARLVAEQPHRHVARQWFRSPDVLALLPMDSADAAAAPGAAAGWALVWSMPDAQADECMALDDAAFTARLSDVTGPVTGAMRLVSPRASWALSRAQVDAWTGPGWVVLGDAAHSVHPLAGQGLNLGLGDVAALAQVLADREPWRALGDPKLLRRFERARALPTWAMIELTDSLLHLFAHPSPIARELRNRGLSLVDRMGPMKRWLTRQALGS